MPAWPAYLLLLAAIPTLVPGLVSRIRGTQAPAATSPGRRPLLAAAVVLGLVPLGVAAAASPVDGPGKVVIQATETAQLLTPVVDSIAVEIEQQGERRIIRWSHPTLPTSVFYRVFRTAGAEDDVACVERGAFECTLTMLTLGTTRTMEFVDGSPPPGVTYRIGVAANWVDDENLGDVFAVSRPVRDR